MLHNKETLNDYLLPDSETISSFFASEDDRWNDTGEITADMLSHESNDNDAAPEAISLWMEHASEKYRAA